MVSLIATFRVKEGMFDQVIDELKLVVPAVRESEPGCLAYIPHTVRGEGNDNLIVFYEKYEDQAAFDVHSANFPANFQNILPLVESDFDIKMCDEIV